MRIVLKQIEYVLHDDVRIGNAEDSEKFVEIFRRLSLKFTTDTEHIDSEIKKFAKPTLCYELRPDI